jgi:hypothetical protein
MACTNMAGFKTENIDSRICLQREKSCTLISVIGQPGTQGLGTPKLKQMGVHETGSTHFLFSAPVGAMADNLADALIRFATKRAGVFVNILCPQNQEICRCCPWPQAVAPQLSND